MRYATDLKGKMSKIVCYVATAFYYYYYYYSSSIMYTQILAVKKNIIQ